MLFCRPASNFFAYYGEKREVSNERAFPIPHPQLDEVNRSLVQRGSLTSWFSDDVAKSWLQKSSNNSRKGRPLTYSDQAILATLIIREVYHRPLRALQLVHTHWAEGLWRGRLEGSPTRKKQAADVEENTSCYLS